MADHRHCDPDGVPLYRGGQPYITATEVARRQRRGEPFVLRLNMQQALTTARDILGRQPLTFTELDTDGARLGAARAVVAAPERWGDVVLVRKDTPTSYHLAVVVDDALQGITHVTRGRDLFAATDLHRLLQVLLGLPQTLYHHHALIMGTDGRKLSKSSGAPSLRSLRVKGLSPADVRTLCRA